MDVRNISHVFFYTPMNVAELRSIAHLQLCWVLDRHSGPALTHTAIGRRHHGRSVLQRPNGEPHLPPGVVGKSREIDVTNAVPRIPNETCGRAANQVSGERRSKVPSSALRQLASTTPRRTHQNT